MPDNNNFLQQGKMLPSVLAEHNPACKALRELAKNPELAGFIMIPITRQGGMGFNIFGINPMQIALAGALCLDKAVHPLSTQALPTGVKQDG